MKVEILNINPPHHTSPVICSEIGFKGEWNKKTERAHDGDCKKKKSRIPKKWPGTKRKDEE